LPAGAESIKVRGTWTLNVVSGDVASLVTNPDMIRAVQIAVAGQVGVASDRVEVTLSEGNASRRLRGSVGADDAAPRRLEGELVAAYVVTFAADEQGIQDANAAANVYNDVTEQELTGALQSAMSTVLLGDTFTLVVQSFDTPSLTVEASDPTTTQSSEITSPALPRAAPLSMAAQLVMGIAVLAVSRVLV